MLLTYHGAKDLAASETGERVHLNQLERAVKAGQLTYHREKDGNGFDPDDVLRWAFNRLTPPPLAFEAWQAAMDAQAGVRAFLGAEIERTIKQPMRRRKKPTFDTRKVVGAAVDQFVRDMMKLTDQHKHMLSAIAHAHGKGVHDAFIACIPPDQWNIMRLRFEFALFCQARAQIQVILRSIDEPVGQFKNNEILFQRMCLSLEKLNGLDSFVNFRSRLASQSSMEH